MFKLHRQLKESRGKGGKDENKFWSPSPLLFCICVLTTAEYLNRIIPQLLYIPFITENKDNKKIKGWVEYKKQYIWELYFLCELVVSKLLLHWTSYANVTVEVDGDDPNDVVNGSSSEKFVVTMMEMLDMTMMVSVGVWS